MELTLTAIDIYEVRKPLKQPFKTSLQTVEERESLIIKVSDAEGSSGYGECVAFTTPWYTEETVVSCRFVIQEVLMPLLLHQNLKHPGQVNRIFQQVKGNRMAKAAVEMAVWDLFAKKKGVPLWKLVGGEQKPIPAGIVVAADPENIERQVAKATAAGYKRIKNQKSVRYLIWICCLASSGNTRSSCFSQMPMALLRKKPSSNCWNLTRRALP
nr:hypothetical protein [Planococcus glaciei]